MLRKIRRIFKNLIFTFAVKFDRKHFSEQQNLTNKSRSIFIQKFFLNNQSFSKTMTLS